MKVINRAGRGRSRDGRSGESERGGFGGFDRRGPENRFSGGFRRGEPGGRSRPQMHEAVCSKCKQRCEVPFKPSPTKPVYCSACFRKDEPEKRPSNLSDELGRINDKLDRIMRALDLG
ncbi:MAG: CxxC-x17-CxxC domain-containing protein [Candidatus Altiarchaeota archaeon]